MQRRFVLIGLVAGCLVSGMIGSVTAHPRARNHVHRHPAQARAVIVVGHPHPAKKIVVVNGVAHGTIDLNVKPRSTEVWVDGHLRGTAGAFDGFPGKLHLRPGVHRVKLVTPGGETLSRDLRVQSGTEINVGLDLR